MRSVELIEHNNNSSKVNNAVNQEIVTMKFYRDALKAGYYTEADIIRYQNVQADDVILQNTPVGIPAPQFETYLDKVNYIIGCGYGIY